MSQTQTTATPVMRDEAKQLDGIYAGLCKPEEYEALVEAGLLRFSYEEAAGFMGLATLRYVGHG